jgi:hypothetical protein
VNRPEAHVADVADRKLFLSDKMGVIQRFASQILAPLGKVFKLAPEVMSIFWDHDGPAIAFNKGGAIFCNA